MCALVLAALPAAGCGREAPVETVPRAVIVDQLFLREANPDFIAAAIAQLHACGFEVDLFQGEDITVDFYRELPERGYDFILFRAHAGLLLEQVDGEVRPLANSYLFTGETYTQNRYVAEQLTDKVSNAWMTDDHPLVFAVNSEFVRDARGGFEDTVIVSMGCESYYYDDMAEAFVEKGASVYLGWSTIVSLEYVDAATLNLLNNLCTDSMTVAAAVERTMNEMGRDPHFDTFLKMYPEENLGKTIAELAGLN
jgi:hypothetical protein